MRVVIVLVCVFLAACGSSDGGSTTTVVVESTEVHIDKVTVTGSAAWPGAQQLEVFVDGQAAQISGDSWSAAIDMQGQNDRAVEVMMYADGQLVAGQEVTVSK